MRKRIQLLSIAAAFMAILSGCHGPLLGRITETYVNQKDASQTLELSAKDTVKGFIHGKTGGPGTYTLLSGPKVIQGKYNREQNTYFFKLDDNKVMKITLQADYTLRDESGDTWKFQSRSRTFRAVAKDVGAHLKALHGGN